MATKTKSKAEMRTYPRRILNYEVRAAGENKDRITGYAAVFYRKGDPGTQYRLWSGCYERVMPGAFDRMMADGDDVRALYNHRPDWILGRRSAGTLKLSVDEIGLRYEIEPAETSIYKDVLEHVSRKDVTGSSFSWMNILEEKWVTFENPSDDIDEVREIYSFGEMVDLGPVTFPAYESSTSDARAEFRDAHDSHDEWRRSRAAEAMRRTRVSDQLRIDQARI